jgi:HEAT repeat protein
MAEFEDFNDSLDDYDDAEESTGSDADKEKKKEVLEELSFEEEEKRLDDFQALQKLNMQKAVKSKRFKPEERKAAIRWLGEAGDPTSIPALIKVYQKDKTPGMKEEAAYALGQLKAMGDALDDPETDVRAYELLNAIVLYGKFGKRSNTEMFRLLEMGLGISAVVLFIVGFLTMFLVGIPAANNRATVAAVTIAYQTDVAPTWTPDTEDIVQMQMQDFYAELLEDATSLQFQVVTASRGQSIDCSSDLLNRPARYALSSRWAGDPRFTPIVDKLNEARDTLTTVREAYDSSCNTNTAIERQTAVNLGSEVLDAQTLLREASEFLATAGFDVPTVVFASPTPAPSNTPAPTATFDLAVTDTYIGQIERLIADMTGPRGIASNNVFYWQQVIESGQIYREGCNLGAPTIPEDYALPAELVAVYVQLDTAVENLNIALLTMRQSSSAFFTACSSGEIPDDAASRLAQANLAVNAFAAAQAELVNIREN